MRVSNDRLDFLIGEDVPYIDLTSVVLGIGDQAGEMTYFTREDCVVAGVGEAARIAGILGCDAEALVASGDRASAGDDLLRVRGSAAALHQAWKVGLNLLDHLSAVATKTRTMVEAAHGANPACEVLTTRKSMPGAKELLTSAVLAGGAFPHRLGLSETVLVFDHHLEFMGGFDAFLRNLPRIRRRCVEKKLFVEAPPERAVELAQAGVDGIQLDKVPAVELPALVERLRSIDGRITLVAAGGIGPHNVGEFAASGVDAVATTAPFSAKPVDMSVRMRSL